MSRVDSIGIAGQAGAGAGGLGTKKTVMDFFIPVEQASPGTNTDTMEAEETIGNPFPTDRVTGTQHFEPSAQGKVRSASAPRLLSGFFGDPTTTVVVAAAVWDHVFDPFVNPVQRAMSLLMTRADPTPKIVDLIWDAIGSELTLGVEPNDWISWEAAWIARELDDTQAAPSVSADLTRRFPFYECLVYISIAGGAEVAIPVSNFSLNYGVDVPTDNNVLGSRKLYKISGKNKSAELSFTPRENLSDYYRRAIALEPDSIKLRCMATGPVISGASRHEVEITCHRAFEIEAPADISAGDSLEGIEVTAQASFDSAASKFITARIRNATASYVVV